jgi:arabinofuranosyltransferase
LIDSDKSIQSDKSAKAIPIIFALLVLAVFVSLLIANTFLCDDAFITFRFSKHLADGIGPVYNSGERVEGYTNFLWMIMMTIVIKLGGQPSLWSRIISACFSCGTLILFFRHAYCNSRGIGALGFIFTLFLITSSPFILWSSGGLETAAFAFFIFSAVIAFTDRGEDSRFAYSSIMFTLAALTRPEGVLAFVIACGFLLLWLIFKKNTFRHFLLFILPFAVLYGIYFIWRFVYYGKFFPNTFYIKEPSSLLLPLGFQYFKRFLLNCPIWIPLILALYFAIRSRFRGFAKGDYYTAVLFLVFSAYIIYVGGDFMDHWRFIMPLIPPWFLLMFHVSGGLIAIKLKKYEIAILTVSMIFYAGFNFNAILKSNAVSYDYNVDSIGALRQYVSYWSNVGKLLSRIGQPTDTIAVTAAGIIPYYSDMYAIDMYGLEAADLTQYAPLQTFTRPGHRMTISLKYLYDNKPHFMIAHPLITENQPRYFPYSQAQDLYPTLLKEYSAVSMALPDLPGYYLNFRVRNDVVNRISGDFKIYKVDYWNQ